MPQEEDNLSRFTKCTVCEDLSHEQQQLIPACPLYLVFQSCLALLMYHDVCVFFWQGGIVLSTEQVSAQLIVLQANPSTFGTPGASACVSGYKYDGSVKACVDVGESI